jgi:hypothetical protein
MSSISIWLFHENDCSNVEGDLKRNEASEIACKARKVRHLARYRLQMSEQRGNRLGGR